MPTRTINTRLAIQGESEYRASLQRINAELKNVQSSLQLTESKYQTNANTMEALRDKGDALQDVHKTLTKKIEKIQDALDNAQAAQKRYADEMDTSKKKIEENNKRLDELKRTTSDTSKEEKALTEENKKLNEQVKISEEYMNAAKQGADKWQTQLNATQIQINDLEAEIKKNNSYLDEARTSSDHCATSIDEFGREVDETTESVKDLGTMLASQELQKFADAIGGVLTDCVQASMDFEDSMARVKRTSGMSDEELKILGDRFKTLSTEMPITTEELAKIAENAGQLGIPKENIEAFTVVMAELGTTTDLSADNAATLMAQFSNIAGVDVSDYERLGSVIADLGDSSATTASRTAEMSNGLAAAGSMAGMQASDIVGIATAVGSIGIESQAGSTAMSNLIRTIDKEVDRGGEKLNQFASVAGMSSQEFRAYWETDAAGALALFIDGLDEVERNGASANQILEDLGINNERQVKAITGLTEAGDLLTDSIQRGREAWEENTALAEKAATMYDTTQAKTKELKNASNNLKIAVGDALAPVVGDLAEKGKAVLEWAASLVEDHPALTEALALVAGGFTGIVGGIASLKGAYKTLDFLGMTDPFEKLAAIAAEAGGGITGITAAIGALAFPAATAATALAGVVAVADHIQEIKGIGFLGEGHSLEEYADNVEVYRQKIEDLQREYDNLAQWGGDLTMVQDVLDTATVGLAHAQEELAAAEESAAQAQEAQTAAVEDAIETMSEETQSVEYQQALNQAMADSIEGVAVAYRTAYDACRESLDGQIGLFDTYAASISEDTNSAQKMLDRWAAQTENLAAYTENLQKAAQYGLDAGLVKSLADGSAQSAGYLATIIAEIENAGDGVSEIGDTAAAAVAAFNENFAKTEEAKDHLAATMTAINEGLTEQLAELEQTAADVGFEGFWDAVDLAFDGVGLKFSEIAGFMGDGLVSGMAGKEVDVGKAAERMADASNNAFTAKEGIRSPSTVWKGFGENLIAGLLLGINSDKRSVTDAVSSMGEDVNNILQSYGQSSTEDFSAAFHQLALQMGPVTAMLHSATTNGLSGLSNDMFIIGNNSVVGMINGILSRSGDLYAAMQAVTVQAISAARKAAEVHSPSRKTMEIFENVGEGMIVGIENRQKALEEKMQSVVDSALDIDVKTNLADKMISIDDRAPSVSGKETDASDRANTVTITRGDTVINVYGAQGQDVRVLAREIASLINDDVAEEDAVWR